MREQGLAPIALWQIWDLPEGCTFKPLERGGYNNFLYRLYHGGKALPFVLRAYGNHANPRYIHHELSVLAHLARQALPFALPLPIPTRRGESYALVDDGRTLWLLVLLPFIPGVNPDPADVAQAEGAAHALGLLHRALATLEPYGLSLPQPYIELGRVHPLVPEPLRAMHQLAPLAPPEDIAYVNAILLRIEQARTQIRRLPHQIIHGDFIPGNVLMEGARVSGVLDFENCAFNPRAMDLAIAVDAWCWDVLGTGEEWARIVALCRGYARAQALREEELALMPVLILLRNASVLMHLIGRFLANTTPYVDVEHWIAGLRRVDGWLTLHGQRFITLLKREVLQARETPVGASH